MVRRRRRRRATPTRRPERGLRGRARVVARARTLRCGCCTSPGPAVRPPRRLLAAALLARRVPAGVLRHLALNDVPALRPRRSRCRRRRRAAPRRGARLRARGRRPRAGGATKYTAAIDRSLLAACSLATAIARRARASGGRWPARRLAAASSPCSPARRVAGFLVAQPLRGARPPDFRAGSPPGARERRAASSGSPRQRARLLPVDADLGARLGARRWPRSAARCSCSARAPRGAVLRARRRSLFVVYMGLQERYFGRWLMPVFPISSARRRRRISRVDGSPAARRGRTPARRWRLRCCSPRASSRVHGDRVLSRPDTRAHARGRGMTAGHVLARALPTRATAGRRPGAGADDGNRWLVSPTSAAEHADGGHRPSPRERGGAPVRRPPRGRDAATSSPPASCPPPHAGPAPSVDTRATSARSRPRCSTTRAQRATAGWSRLDAVRARVRGAAAASRRRSPTTARCAARPSSSPRQPIPRRGAAGAVQLRLVVRLLPARLRAPGPADEGLSPAPRRLRPREADLVHRPLAIACLRMPAARTDTDQLHLARAIELAEQGRGRVSPNPLVGAVVVQRRRGRSARAGTRRYGGPHAEVEAIAAAGDADLRGATLYVSLEPCCHEGKHAAVHRRDRRGRHRAASSSPPTTRPRRPPAAASGSCATRGSRS